MMEQLQLFWQARLPRERVLLAILAGLAVLALYLTLVIAPLNRSAERARSDYRRALEYSATIEAKAAAILTAGRQTNRQAAGPAGALLEQALAEAGISPTNVTTQGDRQVSATFEGASSAAFAQFLAGLGSQGHLALVQLDIQRTSPGRVNAALVARRRN